MNRIRARLEKLEAREAARPPRLDLGEMARRARELLAYGGTDPRTLARRDALVAHLRRVGSRIAADPCVPEQGRAAGAKLAAWLAGRSPAQAS